MHRQSRSDIILPAAAHHAAGHAAGHPVGTVAGNAAIRGAGHRTTFRIIACHMARRSARWLPHALLAGLACTILAGCETVTDAGDIPYVEKIVVDGSVTADSAITGIRFKHTLPVTVNYEPDSAALTDVIGTVRTPAGTFPLVHTGNGYYAAPGAVAHQGDSCILTAEWHGKHVVGATRVPAAPVPYRMDRHVIPESDPRYPTYDSIHIQVRPNDSHAAYSCSVVSSYDGLQYYRVLEPMNGALVKRPADTAADGTLELARQDVSATMQADNTQIRLLAYDAPYLDYLASRDHNSDTELLDSPAPVHWTVTGDAIGVFIGRSVTIAWFP
ncbi:MAG TPA: DUF4249 family protein [Candidatus Kapabacteria bacterium]|nr:DUF4249 family protein [Candidatus Kapabacteria bacterium]